jgi:hypothetical protein
MSSIHSVALLKISINQSCLTADTDHFPARMGSLRICAGNFVIDKLPGPDRRAQQAPLDAAGRWTRGQRQS